VYKFTRVAEIVLNNKVTPNRKAIKSLVGERSFVDVRCGENVEMKATVQTTIYVSQLAGDGNTIYVNVATDIKIATNAHTWVNTRNAELQTFL
jgi:hypothetical protein